MPGFRPISTSWHTPGSVAFAIEDGNKTVVFTGDCVAHKILAIENPWTSLVSDWRPDTAMAGRYEFLDIVVEQGWVLLCGHSAFPGLFHVDQHAANFQTTAATYKASTSAASMCI